MIFDYSSCSPKLQEIFSELEGELQGKVTGERIVLKAEKRELQGYEIRFEADTVRIFYGETNDLGRAFLRACTAQTECDFPMSGKNNIPDLGIMSDCSRNGVLSLKGLKKLIRVCALMGYRFVGLYMEDLFEVKEEPYFGYMRGRFTKEEIREADAYAAKFGMELRPYIQTLAHLNQIFYYEEYRKALDASDILLIGDERTDRLIENMIAAIAGLFTTRRINIGMDEAHLIGLGKYLDLHGFCDRQNLMRDHLKKVLDCCKRYGFKAQIWSDMFFRLLTGGEYYFTEAIDMEQVNARLKEIEIPEGLELAYWDYYHLKKEEYDRMFEAHRLLTEETTFAGGAWCWNGFAPHNRYSIRIGEAGLASAAEHGISSVAITLWGDDGQECSVFATLPTLFSDACIAWEETSSKAEEEALFELLTGYRTEEFLKLDDINPYNRTGEDHNNCAKYLLFDDPLMGMFSSLVKEDTCALFKETAEELEVLSEKRSSYAILFESGSMLCRILSKKADLSIRLKEAYDKGEKEVLLQIAETELPKTAKELDAFYRLFRRQWHLFLKPFGFEVQTVRIGGLKQRLLDAEEILKDYAEGRETDIPELAQERLPFAYESGTIETMNHNQWFKMASPNVIPFV